MPEPFIFGEVPYLWWNGRSRRRSWQPVILEALAQFGFQDLAGRGVGDFRDEGDVVRHPPFGDLALHERENLVLAGLLILLQHDDQQRPLVPFWMLHADHRGLRYFGMADR